MCLEFCKKIVFNGMMKNERGLTNRHQWELRVFQPTQIRKIGLKNTTDVDRKTHKKRFVNVTSLSNYKFFFVTKKVEVQVTYKVTYSLRNIYSILIFGANPDATFWYGFVKFHSVSRWRLRSDIQIVVRSHIHHKPRWSILFVYRVLPL